MAPLAAAAWLCLLLVAPDALAGALRDRLAGRRIQPAQEELQAEGAGPGPLPGGIRILRDIPYGGDRRQRFDVYAPLAARDAPVVLMVHGGAWMVGDKASRGVVENKVARWVPRGFVVVSANYRMVPEADPVEQARDVARALAAAQGQASSWGGDPQRFILMGHSAGAHLAGLLTAAPAIADGQGARPWLGTVLLDSGALDVPAIMARPHPRFYDRAFGSDPGYWQSASPHHRLSQAGTPLLAVCSSRRLDSCPQAERFAAQARRLGTRAEVLPADLSHADINRRLGEDSAYTAAVEAFLAGLDAGVASRIPNPR